MNITVMTREYRVNGFAVARGMFSADLLRDVTEEVERVVEMAAATGENEHTFFNDDTMATGRRPASVVRCVFRIQKRSSYLSELLHSTLMCDFVRPLLGDEPVADGIQYIDKPPDASYEFPYHQDNAYAFYNPPLALAATVALDAQPIESGPIACLRGSHVLDILPHRPSGVLGASRELVESPDTAAFPESVVELRAGDVLVHHTNVIHRTGPNRTPGHRRNLGFVYHGTGATIDTEASAAWQEEYTAPSRSP
jgi:ectoine hydroxylase-related dioxygenase (phytanoyl-CoA dioxygenase family)